MLIRTETVIKHKGSYICYTDIPTYFALPIVKQNREKRNNSYIETKCSIQHFHSAVSVPYPPKKEKMLCSNFYKP